MNTLKNLFSEKKRTLWLIVGVVAVIILVFLLGQGRTASKLAGTAGVSCDSAIVDSDPDMGQVMAAAGLFLRAEPNVNAGSFTALPVCTIFEIQGRSPDSQWLDISVAGLQGWIYFVKDDYVRLNPNMDINDFEVSTATYEHNSSGSANTASVAISIKNNKADVSITGLPANAGFYVMIASDSQSMVFYQGSADAGGKAQFNQEMPTVWADGTSMLSDQLVMLVFLSQSDKQVGAQPFVYYR